MDEYSLMRLSETMDEEAYSHDDFEPKATADQQREEDYRAFYDDVKISIREDW